MKIFYILVFAASFLVSKENATASSPKEEAEKKHSQHLTGTAQEQNALDRTQTMDNFIENLIAKDKKDERMVLYKLEDFKGNDGKSRETALSSIVHMSRDTYEKVKDEINCLIAFEHLPKITAILGSIKKYHGNIRLNIADINKIVGPAIWEPFYKFIAIDNSQKHSDFIYYFLFEMSNAANPYAIDPGLIVFFKSLFADKQTYGYVVEVLEYNSFLLNLPVVRELYPKVFSLEEEVERKRSQSTPPSYKSLEYFDDINYEKLLGTENVHYTFLEHVLLQRESGHTQTYEDESESYHIACSKNNFYKNFDKLLKSNLIKAYLWNPMQDQLVVFAISNREFWRHKMEVGLLEDSSVRTIRRAKRFQDMVRKIKKNMMQKAAARVQAKKKTYSAKG